MRTLDYSTVSYFTPINFLLLARTSTTLKTISGDTVLIFSYFLSFFKYLLVDHVAIDMPSPLRKMFKIIHNNIAIDNLHNYFNIFETSPKILCAKQTVRFT